MHRHIFKRNNLSQIINVSNVIILNLIHLISHEKYNNDVDSDSVNISSPQKHTTLTYIEIHGLEVHHNITYFQTLTCIQDATEI